jgi:hypothetical protein
MSWFTGLGKGLPGAGWYYEGLQGKSHAGTGFKKVRGILSLATALQYFIILVRSSACYLKSCYGSRKSSSSMSFMNYGALSAEPTDYCLVINYVGNLLAILVKRRSLSNMKLLSCFFKCLSANIKVTSYLC